MSEKHQYLVWSLLLYGSLSCPLQRDRPAIVSTPFHYFATQYRLKNFDNPQAFTADSLLLASAIERAQLPKTAAFCQFHCEVIEQVIHSPTNKSAAASQQRIVAGYVAFSLRIAYAEKYGDEGIDVIDTPYEALLEQVKVTCNYTPGSWDDLPYYTAKNIHPSADTAAGTVAARREFWENRHCTAAEKARL